MVVHLLHLCSNGRSFLDSFDFYKEGVKSFIVDNLFIHKCHQDSMNRTYHVFLLVSSMGCKRWVEMPSDLAHPQTVINLLLCLTGLDLLELLFQHTGHSNKVCTVALYTSLGTPLWAVNRLNAQRNDSSSKELPLRY